jgi:hypothetical protein
MVTDASRHGTAAHRVGWGFISLGMRRPWMLIGLVGGSLGILTVALAPSIAWGHA